MPEHLPGGNTNTVVRVGDLVQREAGPWTPTVHRLLHHLHNSGIAWVPQPQGLDGEGHEWLSHLPGVVPQYPMPAWAWDDALLDQAGRHIGELHDATVDFDTDGASWGLEPRQPVEVICHNDLAPYNMVFDGHHRFVGLIDFDVAAPGPRVWDLAHLAYRLVPLHAPGNLEVPPSRDDVRLQRLERLLAAYGSAVRVESMLQTCLERVLAVRDFTERRAGDHERFLAHVRIYDADIAYLRALIADQCHRGAGRVT